MKALSTGTGLFLVSPACSAPSRGRFLYWHVEDSILGGQPHRLNSKGHVVTGLSRPSSQHACRGQEGMALRGMVRECETPRGQGTLVRKAFAAKETGFCPEA